MSFYSYKAINDDGRVLRGSIESIDKDTVRDLITSEGLYIVALKEKNQLISSIHKSILARGIKRIDIIEYANNLAVMLRAGISITLAHCDIAKSIENPYLRQTLNNMRRTIELGSGYSAAAEAQGIFPNIFIQITRVGEETGSLENSLLEVATHLQKMEDLSAALKRALIYPAFAIVATFGALLFWLIYVLPKVMSIFVDTGMPLPLPTKILVAVSNFTQSYWYFLIVFPLMIFFAIKVLKKRVRKVTYYLDLFKIKAPILKHIIYNRLLALFSEQMRILNTAGISIDKSLLIVSDVINNDVFKIAIEKIREEIAMGGTISDSLAKQGVFPPLVTRMVSVGEKSGSLDEQFSHLSEYYLDKLDDISQKMGTIVEPLVIGVVGGMFALIILGLLLPVYELVSKMGSV